jgi:hypothetical protein
MTPDSERQQRRDERAKEYFLKPGLMDEIDQKLSLIVESTMSRFEGACPLHKISILPQFMSADYRVYVFYEVDKDIESFKNNGLSEQIQEYVCSQLELQLGNKDTTTEFEWDSWQNVEANYEGNFILRMM